MRKRSYVVYAVIFAGRTDPRSTDVICLVNAVIRNMGPMNAKKSGHLFLGGITTRTDSQTSISERDA